MKVTYVFVIFALFAVGEAQRDLNSVPQRSNLMAYIPLDQLDGLDDFVNNGNTHTDSSAYRSPRLLFEQAGPHGQYGTAYSVKYGGDIIAAYKYPWYGQFTIAFFLSTRAQGQGGVFFLGWDTGINVMYETPGILAVYTSSKRIGQVSFTPSGDGDMAWQYFAITYSNALLKIYDGLGNELLSTSANFGPGFTTGGETGLTIGDAFIDDFRWARMKNTDAVSCFVMFKTALNPGEIAQLPSICKKNAKAVLWPRSDALYGYWPLNNGELFDVGVKVRHASASSNGAFEKTNGPYGNQNSAIVATSNDKHLFDFQRDNDLGIARNAGKFTVAMHFSKGPNNEKGCIFEFLDAYNSERAFQICYADHSYIELYANTHQIGRYQIVQQKGVWTFMAFVFDGTQLTVYSKHGVFSRPAEKSHLSASYSFNNKGIRVGYSTKKKQYLSVGDSLACLMVYETALSIEEVKQARDSCRVVLGSKSCGSSSTASLEFSSNSVTTPKAGDFPFTASLRYQDNHVCSVTLIDQYWGLSLSQCFAASSVASLYKVIIGEYDLVTAENFEQERLLEKIVLQPASGATVADGELALISFTEPVDLATEWVNDACLIANDIKTDLTGGMRQLVYGWHPTGSLNRKTLPGYYSGLILADKQCEDAWGDLYRGDGTYCFLSMVNDTETPCDTDLGAPLLAKANENLTLGFNERLVQLGLFYRRHATCTTNQPSLFVSIDEPAFGWVTENIACAVPGVFHPKNCPRNG